MPAPEVVAMVLRASTLRLATGIVAVLLVGACAAPAQPQLAQALPSRPASAPATAPAADADQAADPNANPEAGEQAETTGRKKEALDAAVAAGVSAGQQRPAADAPTAGWSGEVPFEATAPDDWEPAVAADPAAPYVYVLVTRYGIAKPCNGNCPSPYIALKISSDGGATFGASKPLCACKGSGQYDPIIEVVPKTGAVYALYLNGFNVMFVKSTNHGASWSSAVPVYGNVSWTDKPVIAVSDDGKDVYATFNGPTGGDPYVAVSHDAGATWRQTKLADTTKYFFAFDADVASDGTVYLAQSALQYGGGGNKGTYPTGLIDEHVFVSRDAGATWTDRLVGSVQPGTKCVTGGCTPDYWLGHNALTVDAAGNVVLLYDGVAPTGAAGAPQSIWVQRSSNQGATWTTPVSISTAGEEATDPAVEAAGTGDLRAWYMQTSGGVNLDQWNVWYRRSADGGVTWTSPVRLSDATGGAAYKGAAGFLEPYGDYGEVAVTSAGKTFAVWGEGASYDGPGGVWYTREN